MERSMKNRVVLITGGSRGIGAELVRSFCSLGAKVYFTFKSNQQAAQEIMNSTGAIGKKVDGSNEKEVKEFCDYVGKEHKVIDVLVNNAGSVPRALLVDTTVDVFKSAFLSNVGGVFNFSRSCLKYLLKSSYPSIINISSVASNRPNRGLGVYCCTKGAIESLSQVMALEFAPYKIRVNTVAPGLVKTEVSKDITDETKERILERTPLKRFGEVQDIAGAVVFLASDMAKFITGIQLYVTGGKHLN